MNGKLILGTAQMGLDYGINNSGGKLSPIDSFNIFNYAYDKGIRILDTAEAYGDSHKVIGEFHMQHPEKKFLVITKISLDFNAIEHEDINDKVHRYLIDLKVDQLEGLMFHSYNIYKLYEPCYEKVLNIKRQGLFKYLGVSIYTNEEFEDVINDDRIDLIQIPFNVLDNINLRGDLLKLAKERNKIIHSRSAFLQGLFFKEMDSISPISKLKNEHTTISNLSKVNNLSISDLALSYCLAQPTIDKVIIGVDSVSQLQSNIKSAAVVMNEHLINEINSIVVSNIDLLNPSLWNL